jgi:hypothetical protein
MHSILVVDRIMKAERIHVFTGLMLLSGWSLRLRIVCPCTAFWITNCKRRKRCPKGCEQGPDNMKPVIENAIP